MTRLETWSGFALIGFVVGAISLGFGTLGWPMTAAVVLVAALSPVRMPALAGTFVGLAVGMAVSAWLGSECPAGAICRPEVPTAYISGFIVTAACLGAVGSLIAARPPRGKGGTIRGKKGQRGSAV